MTTMQEALDLAVLVAKDAKDKLARKRDNNLSTMLVAYRGEEPVAHIFPEQQVNRDEMLKCALLAVRGFSADMLALIFETWQATDLINPVTGKRWGPREMQDAADNHDGVAKGWITDALMVSVYNRAGDATSTILPYRISNKVVVWSKPMEAATALGGYVHNALLQIMRKPDLDTEMTRMGVSFADFNLTAEEGRAHQDIATVKMFTGQNYIHDAPRANVALVCTEHTLRAKILRDRLPTGKVFRP